MEPDFKKARSSAQKALADNYVLNPPVNIRNIARNYGLDVSELDFSDNEQLRNVTGFIDLNGEKVFVDKNDPESRKVFTIAHELGHWLLHKDLLEKEGDRHAILYRKPLGETNRDPVEAEANYFAAYLLVPSEALKKARINEDDDDVTSLAKTFGVSEDMMGYRLKEVDGQTDHE